MSYLELAKKVQTLIEPTDEDGPQKDPKEFVDQYIDEKIDFEEPQGDITRYSNYRKY